MSFAPSASRDDMDVDQSVQAKPALSEAEKKENEILEADESESFSAIRLHRAVSSEGMIVQTGCDEIDAVLVGGLVSGEITEFVGSSGSGKTQLCMSIAAHAVKEDVGVAYIDSSGSFTAKRFRGILANICQGEEISEESLPLKIFRVFDLSQFTATLDELERGLAEEDAEDGPFYGKLRLLIVDAISPIISSCSKESDDETGSKFLSQGVGVKLSLRLRRLAWVHHLVVVVVNGAVMKSVAGSAAKHAPALGKAWGWGPAVRLWFEPSRDSGQLEERAREAGLGMVIKVSLMHSLRFKWVELSGKWGV